MISPAAVVPPPGSPAPASPLSMQPTAPHVIPADQDPLSRQVRLLLGIRKHWLLASLIAIAVALASAFYTLGRPRIYRASTTLQIDPNPPQPLGRDVQGVMDLGTGMYWNNREYYQTQYRVMKSRSIALLTVRKLGLHRSVHFMNNTPSSPSSEGLKSDTVAEPEAAADLLLSRLTVEPIRDSRLVKVNLEDADPERARRILAAHVSVYIERNVDRVLDSTKSAADWLTVQREKLREELTGNELALHDYKRTKNILSVSMDDQSNMLREEMRQLNAELTGVRAEAQELRARRAQLSDVDPQQPQRIPIQELLDSTVLTNLRARFAATEQEVKALLGSGKGQNHPLVKAARAKLESERSTLVNEVSNLKAAISKSLETKEREIQGLAGLFGSAKKRALELSHLELEYRRLERSKRNTEKLYSVVLERSKESSLTQIMRFNNISVVDEAQASASPVKPNLPANLGLGIGCGILLGLMAALVRAAGDQTIKIPDDIERELQVPFLGTMPCAPGSPSAPKQRRKSQRNNAKADEAPELQTFFNTRSLAAEAARAIRTNLMFMSPDRPQRRLLITSGGPEEGKTTIACGVAIAMAQAGLKVLLLDCDLRRPRTHRIFKKANSLGVTTLMLEPDQFEPEKLTTLIPNLSLLPAGPHVPNPAELIQSERFSALLDQLGTYYDRIVIDSPPVIAVTDAPILSTKVDGTLFVARGGATRIDLARRTLRTLRDITDNVLGVVLNAADNRGGYGYYYHRYEYTRRPEQDDDPQA